MVLYNSKSSSDKVTILSGGGAGHEPLHGGFVGNGLLDVAVSGQVFASPSVKQVYAGICMKKSKKGTLVVVKNYTGDILHFGMATERLKAEDYPNRLLIVQDDVAVPRSKNHMVGQRGIAGTCLVHKIVGARSAINNCSASLDEVYETGKKVVENLATVGASLDQVVIPKVTKPGEKEEHFDDEEEAVELGDNEAEIGMGIHNEPGVERVSPIPNIRDLIDTLLKYILSKDDKERHYTQIDDGDEVALLINSLGATSNLEKYAIENFTVEALEKKYHIKPARIYTGTFTTSLDGPGFSITILNITKAGGDIIKQCLDYPTDAPAWNCHISTAGWDAAAKESFLVEEPEELANPTLPTSDIKLDPKLFSKIATKGCQDIVALEPKLTLYDKAAGDGDCGETASRGANAVIDSINDKTLNITDAVTCFTQMTDLVETAMGGTSGGLYAIYIGAMAASFRHQQKRRGGGFNVDIDSMITALQSALRRLEVYTRAREGDRTLMDALIPFVNNFAETKDVRKAADAAHKGAEATRKMSAKFGRAAYVSAEEFKLFDKEGGLPDPGAIGLAGLLKGFADAYYANK